MTRTQQLIALFALSLAGSAAMADDITTDNQAFVAQKTRAEVKAEVLQAQAAGTLRIGEGEVATPVAVRSVVTVYSTYAPAWPPTVTSVTRPARIPGSPARTRRSPAAPEPPRAVNATRASATSATPTRATTASGCRSG